MTQHPTSWGTVANWYDEYLGDVDTYQAKVIWPNLKRILASVSEANAKKNTPGKIKLLDMACGQGYFSYLASTEGYEVVGADIAPELIAVAKSRQNQAKGSSASIDNGMSVPEFHIAPADNMPMMKSATFDIVICILALQNIKELDQTIAECQRVLKPGGHFVFVLNHPSFRIPQHSDWYFDEKKKIQSRLVSKYMQEDTIRIDMQPGNKKPHNNFTVSFHRPLQLFVKLLAKHDFVISRLEEWCSHKKTEAGPRKAAEDEARKEIPMFMCIEARAQ